MKKHSASAQFILDFINSMKINIQLSVFQPNLTISTILNDCA